MKIGKPYGGWPLPVDKNLAPVLTAVFLGVLVITILSYVQTRNTLHDLAVGQITQTMAVLDREVTARIQAQAFHVDLWSHEDVFRLALEDTYLGISAREAANTRLAARVGGGISDRIFLAQAEGSVVAASLPGMAGNMNVSDRHYFKQAMRGMPSREVFAKGRYTGHPVEVYAAPVKDYSGTVIGVLVAVLETENFAADMLRDVHLGKNGGALLYSDAIGPLATPSWVKPDQIDSALLAPIIHSAAEKNVPVSYTDKTGERLLVSIRNKDTGWFMVMDVNAGEFNKPATRQAGISGVISLCTLAVVGFALGALRRAMVNLRHSDSRSRTLTALSPVGIVTFDEQQHPTYMNDQARDILGVPLEPGAKLPERLPFLGPEGLPLPPQSAPSRVAQETGRTITGQMVWFRKYEDSPLRILSVNAAAVAELGVVATVEDITSRSLAEERLRQSEEKFSQLFRLSPDSIILTDMTTRRIVDVNETFVRFTGYGHGEAVGRTSEELGLILDSAVPAGLYERLTMEDHVENVEFEVRRKDKTPAICSASSARIRIGSRDLMLSLVRDVTEVKKMQEMMIQTEKMISVGGIAAGIAHEINNPLGIILQAAQNMLQRTRTDFPKNVETAEKLGLSMEALEQYLKARKIDAFIMDIQSAALRASAIIRHMLDFSRRSESKRKVCEIIALIDKAVELASSDYDLKKSYDFRKIVISKDYDDDLPGINCTETEIEQVLLNILRNAAQAQNPPVENPRIDIRLRGLPDRVRIEIEDNGPGIPVEVRRRVFEPFFTTKGTGVGTGLGLSVSYFIVTKGHGGSLSVSNGAGGGAMFVIELPTDEARGPVDG